MEWYNFVEVISVFIIIPLLIMVWNQNNTIQKINSDNLAVHQKETDGKLEKVADSAKTIEKNYLTRFKDVNDNITGLRADITSVVSELKYDTGIQLTRIETNFENIPCIKNSECIIK